MKNLSQRSGRASARLLVLASLTVILAVACGKKTAEVPRTDTVAARGTGAGEAADV
jgi:hypothetical protein